MQAKDNKMEHIGKIVAYLILAINAFFVGTLILSAYSPYLNPKLNPLSSGLGLAFPLFLVINIAFIIFWVFINYRYALVPLIGFLVCFPQKGPIFLSIPLPRQSRKEVSKFFLIM